VTSRRGKKHTGHECEPPRPEPLAPFLTWPTYGTWLPGHERGWVQFTASTSRGESDVEQPLARYEHGGTEVRDGYVVDQITRVGCLSISV
jgi:hypothetical protein